MGLAGRVLVGAVLLTGSRIALPRPTDVVAASRAEDGAVAPAGTWYVAEGCAARTAECDTPPIRGPLVRAWETTLPGEIESEPLVWDETVVVALRLGEAKCALAVVALGTGKVLYRKTFDSDVALEPCLWKRTVLARTGAYRLEAFAIGRRELTPRWRYDDPKEDPVRAPLLFGEEVYARVGPWLVQWRLGRAASVWKRPAVRSDPCLRGGLLYVVEYDPTEGKAHLAAVSRSTGDAVRTFVGQHEGGRVPPETASADVRAFAEDVIVRHARPVLAAGGGSANGAWGERVGGSVRERGLLDVSSGPVAAGDTWMALRDDEEGRTLSVLSGKVGGGSRYEILADARLHPEFLDLDVPPTVLGSVVYVGGRAFDRESRRILRAKRLPTRFRAVPARDTVLLADGPRLTAYREDRGPRRPPAVTWAAGPATAIAEGVAVLDDGTLLAGPLAYDPVARTVASGRKGHGVTASVEDVLLVQDRDGRVLHALGADEVVRAVAALSERELAKGFVALAAEAAKKGDAVALADALGAARTAGAAEADLQAASKRLEALEKASKVVPEAVHQALAAAQEALLARERDRLWRSTAALPEATPFEVRADLVREVLGADPAHAEASAWVRAQLPEGVAVPEPFAAAEWLEFVEAVRQTPIRIVPPPAPGQRDLTYAQRELGSARHFWRPDLLGLESGQLLILTPLRRPGHVARALSVGELVCTALEGIFAKGDRRRDERYPLILRLYESQDEYVRDSERRRPDGTRVSAAALEWTSGHYSPADGLSRIYLPEGERAFEDVVGTYAHELTHHWIDQRCPCFSEGERGGGAMTPGIWLVEGMATFVQEMRFDPRARTASADDARAESLDVVASADPKSLVPWDAVFEAGALAFGRLDRKPSVQVPLRWSLGQYRVMSETNLFYAQAGAACHYLHRAEDGRHREALVALVTDHYTGALARGGVQARLGIEPAELGARIVRWAKDVGADDAR